MASFELLENTRSTASDELSDEIAGLLPNTGTRAAITSPVDGRRLTGDNLVILRRFMEIDLVSFQWCNDSEGVRHGAPIGERDEVARRFVQWLLDNGDGELMAQHLAASDFAE